MALDFDKMILDSIDLVTAFDISTGVCDFMMDEVKDGKIENGEDTVYLTGKNGARIGALSRNKTAKFSCNNGFFIGGAMATQIGSTPTIASDVAKLVVPTYDIIDVPVGGTTIVLSEVPVGVTGAEISHIYKANPDGTQGASYTIGATASATQFSLVPATKTITLPTDLFKTVAGQVIVFYDYETAVGKKYVNQGDKFSKTEKIIVDMTLRDVCDNSTMYHGKFVFKGKVDGTFSIGVANEPEAHAFSAESISNVCSKNKDMWSFFIVE